MPVARPNHRPACCLLFFFLARLAAGWFVVRGLANTEPSLLRVFSFFSLFLSFSVSLSFPLSLSLSLFLVLSSSLSLFLSSSLFPSLSPHPPLSHHHPLIRTSSLSHPQGESTVFKAGSGSIRSVKFSHDGSFLVSGSDDKLVKVWSMHRRQWRMGATFLPRCHMG